MINIIEIENGIYQILLNNKFISNAYSCMNKNELTDYLLPKNILNREKMNRSDTEWLILKEINV